MLRTEVIKPGRKRKEADCRPCLAILLFLFALFFGCSDNDSDSSARFTIKTPPFPEIQEMVSKISVSLEIAGKTCLFTIDPEKWTPLGQCPDLPNGSHAFTLNYQHNDWGVIIASATGTATLTSGNDTNTVEIKTLKKDQDNDGDGYSNLVEAMFQTNPDNGASKPGMPPFSPLTSFSVGKGPSSLVLGHLNPGTDSFLDIVTANGEDDTVTVLLGNGDGTFKAAENFATGVTTLGPRVPVEIVLARFNSTPANNLDLVVINSGEEGKHPGNLAVLLGNGDGSFQSAAPDTTGNQPSALVLGDLNGDGNQDAVTGNFESQTLSVLLGNTNITNGIFQTALPLPLSPPALLGEITALALGQIDADATLDLLVSTRNDETIKVLIGQGDGTFQSTASLKLGVIISLELEDLNGDSFLDLIAALAADKIAVLMGNGDGSFQSAALFNAGKTPGSLSFADLDGDGNIDIVTENEGEGVIAVLRGKGNGTFHAPVFFEVGAQPSWTALGDLNGDGHLDVVTSDRASGNINVLLSK